MGSTGLGNNRRHESTSHRTQLSHAIGTKSPDRLISSCIVHDFSSSKKLTDIKCSIRNPKIKTPQRGNNAHVLGNITNFKGRVKVDPETRVRVYEFTLEYAGRT